MSELNDNLIEKKLEIVSIIEPNDKVAEKAVQRVRKKIMDLENEKTQFNVWRIIMKSPITKLAAAAVIIVAILIGLNLLGVVVKGSVAWANVARKMETIDSFRCRKRERETSSPTQDRFEFVKGKKGKEGMYWYSVEYGTKSESYTDGELMSRVYSLRKTKEFFGIFPQLRMYNYIRLSDEVQSKWDREDEQMNPRQVVKRFLASDYKPLGRNIIDSIQVEGVEVKDPNILKPPGKEPEWQDFIARLWVDVEIQLPVRLEVGYSLAGSPVRNIMVTDQFQWNVELTASDFEPNIPPDYTLIEK